ncbi:hypothetical protein [Bradyrhizobium sp. 27S5]|jgi:hypothetical protein|uniref:hypothetical protein n=1 Tax=Bradyrhizobium sp. 27S5 TaxID=3139728 RepID=UPI0030CB29CE
MLAGGQLANVDQAHPCRGVEPVCPRGQTDIVEAQSRRIIKGDAQSLIGDARCLLALRLEVCFAQLIANVAAFLPLN